MRGVKPERPAYTVTFRFKQPDGRKVWLEETAKAEFDAIGGLVRLKGLTLDVTARKRSEDQQSLLIAALDHHVKNLLARVAVVAKDMRQSSGLARRVHSSARSAHSIHGRCPCAAQPESLGTASTSPSSSAVSLPLRDRRKHDDRRPERRAHCRGDPGVGDGAARTRDERREIRCACRPRTGGWK